MADIFDIQVEGASEFVAKLERLERKVRTKIIKEVCKKGLAPTLSAAKVNAAALGSGLSAGGVDMSVLMAKKLKIYMIKGRNLRRGHYGSQVRFQANVPEFIDGNYYIPNAIEYGHAFPGAGGRKGAGKDVAARPFIRPAFDATKHQAKQIAEQELKAAIDREENR